ncbi:MULTISPECIES: sugar ABC transporter ATP-binding protein [unclassified Mesorhizobium]|uniref:sugar ABC transporter ATP-binding protein n=1 Tax=unclassified Mesorhizobium TaxID=325217 RepID=UPI0009676E08|nr:MULTISPECIES: sugar ABC transporter ATP-binding protein [unclassified Mesorhizobium]MBN9255436.1 sugar ABC transporter ATP-binding protein [Mesorhizobium sp.]OJX77964.1 MAG: ABC transporter ATP-binding protein [Mesorhizobium sp. 65-26]
MENIVEFRNATKTFSGIAAFRDIDFTLRKGEIHALLGENGAGKSTLTKVIAGVYRPTSGKMLFDGREVSFGSPAEGLRNGVVMVFQETNLVPAMTVAQNIYLGDEKAFNRLRGLYIEARQFLVGMGFQVDPTAQVSTLGAAQKQMVEIARAVHHKARVIIFDEPTATLTPEEKRHFFSLIDRLKKQGTAIVFITHALEEALQVADRITVLRDGELAATGDAKDFTRASVVQAMVGRNLTETLHGARRREPRPYGEKVLSVENLSCGSMVRNSSFSVFGGQVTGIFGLVGAGRSEMAKVVAGVLKRDFLHGGEIRLNGNPVRYRVPRPAMRDGIVYVTEDRKVDGFFETMTAGQNLLLGELSKAANPVTPVSMGRAVELAREWGERLQLKQISDRARMIELSGGNQQKVVIAKSLIQEPKLIIFDEPTRGVDVGAIVEIHKLIHDLADQGLAVVVISSYLPEIMAVSDRILVAKRGRVVEEMLASEADEAAIMFAAVH